MWRMRRFVTHETQCHACEDNVVSSMSRMSHTRHVVMTHMKNYLNGPTFEHLSEEEKQIRWMIMKARFPIFDKDYQMLLLDMYN